MPTTATKEAIINGKVPTCIRAVLKTPYLESHPSPLGLFKTCE